MRGGPWDGRFECAGPKGILPFFVLFVESGYGVW